MIKRTVLSLVALLILAGTSLAQQGNTTTIPGSGAASGTCGPLMFWVNYTNGDFYDCNAGAWNLVSGGGGGAVSSVFTRTGAVVAVTGDYPWNFAANPTGNLSLTMGSNTSTFNTTTALSQMFAWKNTTAAVVGTSQGSPILANCGRAFHGSADVEDCMTFSELPGNGNDATIAFTIGHTGTSTGTVVTSVPAVFRVGTGTSSLPSIGFAGSTNTGINSLGAASFVGVAGGVNQWLTFANGFRMVSGMALGWSSADPAVNGADVAFSRLAAGVTVVGTGAANSRAGLILAGNSVFVTSNFTTSGVGTALENITGLTWTFPATAANYNFNCHMSYSQAVGAAAVAFGIKATTTAPTNIFANGEMFTAAGTVTTGTLATLASTTATNIVSGTPGAQATNFVADLYGTMELGAGATTINLMTSTATAADLVTVLRGSYCSLAP